MLTFVIGLMVTLIDRWLYVQGFTTTALSFISLLINTNEQFCVPYSVNMVGSGSRNTTHSLFYTVLFEWLQVLVTLKSFCVRITPVNDQMINSAISD